MAPESMSIDSESQSRKIALQDAVVRTLTDVFNAPQVRTFLEAELAENESCKSNETASNIISHISDVMQQSVRAQVDSWMHERGLDQVFEALDESSLTSAALASADESSSLSLATPCSTYPGVSFAQIKLNCKQQQLDVLKKQLKEDETKSEHMKAEVAKMMEAAMLLNNKLNHVDNSSDIGKISATL